MFWLLKLLIDDTERSNIGGGCKVDDNGDDIWKSSKLPAQEYGGGIIVLASFTALHRKLELSESAVLVADSEPTGRTM